jgi:TonB family protein
VIVDEALLEDDDVTIAPTTLERNPVETLPPPPVRREEKDLAAAPTFTPMTVQPTLRNATEITRALMAYYPPLLKEAGIGGRVLVWFFIDENGRVVKTLLKEPSGYSAFDEAALRVASLMEFSPAYNYDQRVPVWVAIPITFEVLNR